MLVLGPPRSGKTLSVVVPNVLAAFGPVIAVSTKRDVLDATLSARARLGECLIFDPTRSVDEIPEAHRVGWSPLRSSRSWDGAVLTAEAMVGASREGRNSPDGSHWTERAAALLSTLFHAAALSDFSFSDVVSAVNRREPQRFSSVLARADAEQALDLLKGLTETEEREQSAIWSTASSVLSGYRTRAAVESASMPSVDADRFVASCSTLFIAAPAEHQLHLAPLVAGVLRDIRTAAYRRFASTAVRADADAFRARRARKYRSLARPASPHRRRGESRRRHLGVPARPLPGAGRATASPPTDSSRCSARSSS